MGSTIQGKRVAFLAADGFELSELRETRRLIDEAGAQTVVVSLEPGEIRGWKNREWAETVAVDVTLGQSSASRFDALVIPGGVMSPDTLRVHRSAVDFVREFVDQGKLIGAICHGPWLLAEADAVHDRRVTSWLSLKTDLENAGAFWTDSEVVCDQGIVTSRKPGDIPSFAQKFIDELSQPSQESMRVARAVSFI